MCCNRQYEMVTKSCNATKATTSLSIHQIRSSPLILDAELGNTNRSYKVHFCSGYKRIHFSISFRYEECQQKTTSCYCLACNKSRWVIFCEPKTRKYAKSHKPKTLSMTLLCSKFGNGIFHVTPF